MSSNASNLNKDVKNPFLKKTETPQETDTVKKEKIAEVNQEEKKIGKLAVPSVFGAGPKKDEKKPIERKKPSPRKDLDNSKPVET